MAREMKDSGVEWIGKIPATWSLIKMKNCIIQRDSGSWGEEAASDCNDVICLRVADFDYSHFRFKDTEPRQLTIRHYPPEVIQKLLLREKDILIEKSGGGGKTPVGRTVLFDKSYPALFANFMDRLRCNNFINSEFMQFIFATFYKNEYIKNYIKQTTGIQNLDLTSMLAKEVVAVPSTQEQEKIVLFLNKKCSEIDALLEKIRASIEEYKKLKQTIITQAVTKGVRGDRPMKDSGIEWIGETPEDWIISSLGKFVSVESGISVGRKYETGVSLIEVPYLRVANVQGDHVDLSNVATILVTPEEAEYYRLKPGQLLMTEGGDRDKLGRGCLWNGEIENCIHQNHVFAVQPDDKVMVEYLDFVTTSEVSRIYFDITAKKTTNLACTSKSAIQKLTIPIPPITEQQEIACYLKEQCKRIDEIIIRKEMIVKQITDYKKSLIYEYVTGKRGVPKAPNQSVITFLDARALLMCRIIEQLEPKGRIHLMKALYIIDCLLNLNTQTQYVRQKHGPYDANIEDYEKNLMQHSWIVVNSGNPVNYTHGSMFSHYRPQYLVCYKDVDSEIQRICAFLKPMRTSQAERIATLLAAWNDFIIDGKTPTDEEIIDEVRTNWTPNKANSSESTWRGTLSKMKDHKIIPSGYGNHTIHMQKSEV